MTNFPRMMFFATTTSTEDTMLDFEDINRILDEMAQEKILEPTVEPIDDPDIQMDFYDWAEVVGLSDEIEPDIRWA